MTAGVPFKYALELRHEKLTASLFPFFESVRSGTQDLRPIPQRRKRHLLWFARQTSCKMEATFL
jgi:hypothetical protein